MSWNPRQLTGQQYREVFWQGSWGTRHRRVTLTGQLPGCDSHSHGMYGLTVLGILPHRCRPPQGLTTRLLAVSGCFGGEAQGDEQHPSNPPIESEVFGIASWLP